MKKDLPEFCYDFFTGVENTTSTLTRLNYAMDLNIFFTFFHKSGERLYPTSRSKTRRAFCALTLLSSISEGFFKILLGSVLYLMLAESIIKCHKCTL